MRVIRSLLVVLAIGVATLSSAQARDSVSFSLNIGAPGYYAYPAEVQYVAPPAVYYPGYSVYYDTPYAYRYYYPAAVYRGSYGVYGGYYSGHHHHRGYGHRDGYRR